MLNDYFITRDAIGFLRHYLACTHESTSPVAGDLLAELEQISQRQHMSYALWWQTLEDMAQGLNEPCLGLEVGRRVSVAQCGVLGYLFRTSRNALEALSCFKRFERLIYAGSQVRTEQDTHTLALVWDPEHGYSSQLSDELLLAAMVNVVREIMSPSPFDPVAVNFTQALPTASRARYEDFFACEVKEKQARLSIVFKLETLLQPIPYRDEQLHQLLDQQAEAQLSTLPADDVFLETFRDTVLRALHEGRPEAEYVAQQLNMSSRTLHRNLQQRNKLYREELRELRQTMAQRYLRDKKLTLSEIALLLGYAEQSVFTRAFKQWFDQSPAQWRKQYCS